jgi:triosephosphate isomerase
MRKKIVAGNWKMNKTLPEAIELVENILKANTSAEVYKIFIPPFPFIYPVSKAIEKTASHFFVGAQNLHDKESGAFTGETSLAALTSVGATMY